MERRINGKPLVELIALARLETLVTATLEAVQDVPAGELCYDLATQLLQAAEIVILRIDEKMEAAEVTTRRLEDSVANQAYRLAENTEIPAGMNWHHVERLRAAADLLEARLRQRNEREG